MGGCVPSVPPSTDGKQTREPVASTHLPTYRLSMRRMVGLVVVIWLVIGAVAAGQRGYFGASPKNCAGAATVATTVIVGPLNYLGVNPKVTCPQPSR